MLCDTIDPQRRSGIRCKKIDHRNSDCLAQRGVDNKMQLPAHTLKATRMTNLTLE